MAEPKEGYNSGIQRVVSSGAIDSDGNYVVGGAAHATLTTELAGERNVGLTNQYAVGIDESTIVVRIEDATEVVVSDVPFLLMGIIVNTASTGTATVIDAATTASGTNPIFNLDVAAAATRDNAYDFKGVKMLIGCAVKGSAASTDITVIGRPI